MRSRRGEVTLPAREINGEQFILTTWLLTIETAPEEDWNPTLVGKDTFTRVAPSPAAIAKLKVVKGPSNHLKETVVVEAKLMKQFGIY